MSGRLTLRPARLAAIALLGMAAVAAAIAASRVSTVVPWAAAVSASPLSAELARCRALGIAAQEDAACRRAWRASRRRFLGQPAETAS
ncbi:putative entry exclusion protein TrbK-alt [Phenylobacterium sp.]|uniref:putative entry exclusion protein TrbK-alt n=1 Tax=Phenylobacterium sp. TaxID=1871053 RepID=UPI003D2E2BCD